VWVSAACSEAIERPALRQSFDGYFSDVEPRQRLEVINPVQTKVHKYVGSLVARQIVGQPKWTIDFRQLVAERKIVLINLNAFDVGEDVAVLVGGTLLKLAARAVSAQAVLPPEDRQPVTLVVDEFRALPGADYEQVSKRARELRREHAARDADPFTLGPAHGCASHPRLSGGGLVEPGPSRAGESRRLLRAPAWPNGERLGHDRTHLAWRRVGSASAPTTLICHGFRRPSALRCAASWIGCERAGRHKRARRPRLAKIESSKPLVV
jgi:hypothetical protein